jgi:hypothetical protein
MINATHHQGGIEGKIFVRKFMEFRKLESDAGRIPRNLHAAKVTKGSF